MAILDVLSFPDERLRTVAKPVEEVNDDIKQLVSDMFETMKDENGIGLAATQVDRHVQVVVMNVAEDQDEPRVFINPEITKKDGSTISEEGCLSVPYIYAKVKRASSILVEAQNEKGEKIFDLLSTGCPFDFNKFLKWGKENFFNHIFLIV